MRREQPDASECNGAIHQPLQHQRMPVRRSSGLDPIVRRAFGQVKRLRAVDKHRRVPFSEIQLAAVDLGQKRDELRGRSSFNGDDAGRFGEELVIREGGD
jgi:hypothetical protein